MLEFFGVDLLDLWCGRLSLRRIHVLINSLMHKAGRSTLLAVLDETTLWGSTEHMLARISDALELSNYLFIKANTSEDAEEMPLPTPLPRPGVPEESEPQTPDFQFASGEELSNFFAQMNNL
ncbi:hypothetical protein H9W91_07295 [Streptomyces alfalfae]|uniref:hypothetical protein n=1 Tax=Streptomyces alfalfae TaxID=1642299 RepID=UPI001BA7CCCB|nr:hypothetical protein [Streptomyces alfalfae]QUI30684.1 hypothetical protein H9W91_07295 [Streptomyces alfalfae]